MITQWVLIIMFTVSPGPEAWIKEVPMPSEKACLAAIAGRGRSTMTPSDIRAFDNDRLSLMCVETGIVGAD